MGDVPPQSPSSSATRDRRASYAASPWFCSTKSVQQVDQFGRILKNHYKELLAGIQVNALIKKKSRHQLRDCPLPELDQLDDRPPEEGCDFEQFDDLSAQSSVFSRTSRRTASRRRRSSSISPGGKRSRRWWPRRSRSIERSRPSMSRPMIHMR